MLLEMPTEEKDKNFLPGKCEWVSNYISQKHHQVQNV